MKVTDEELREQLGVTGSEIEFMDADVLRAMAAELLERRALAREALK